MEKEEKEKIKIEGIKKKRNETKRRFTASRKSQSTDGDVDVATPPAPAPPAARSRLVFSHLIFLSSSFIFRCRSISMILETLAFLISINVVWFFFDKEIIRVDSFDFSPR